MPSEVVDSIVSVVIGEPIHDSDVEEDGDQDEEEEEDVDSEDENDNRDNDKGGGNASKSDYVKIKKVMKKQKDKAVNDDSDEEDIMITDEQAMEMITTDITESELEQLGAKRSSDEVNNISHGCYNLSIHL